MDYGDILQYFVGGSRSDLPMTALATIYFEQMVFKVPSVQYQKTNCSTISNTNSKTVNKHAEAC